MRLLNKKADFAENTMFDDLNYGSDAMRYYGYNEEQVRAIKRCEESGFDVLPYASNGLNHYEIEERMELVNEGRAKIPQDFEELKGLGKLSNEQLKKIIQERYMINLSERDLPFNEDEVDFRNNTEEKYNALIKKMLRVQESMRSYNRHLDTTRRNTALMYINGEFIEAPSHMDAINAYLRKINSKVQFEPDMYGSNSRPSVKELKEELDENDVFFAAHVIHDVNSVQNKNLGIRNQKAVYLVVQDEWLNNISIKEAANAVRSSRQYSGYAVYEDESWEFNEQDWMRDYKTARLKKRIKHAQFESIPDVTTRLRTTKHTSLDYRNDFNTIINEHLDEGPDSDDYEAGRYTTTCVVIGTMSLDKILQLEGREREQRGWREENGQRWFGNYTEERWNEFLRDIEINGIINPIFIGVEKDGSVYIYEGNHRVQAAKTLGLSEVPVEVRYYGNSQRSFRF